MTPHRAVGQRPRPMGRLFKSGVDPVTLIKWKEIYDLIETATDKCLDVADVIEGVVLEHS